MAKAVLFLCTLISVAFAAAGFDFPSGVRMDDTGNMSFGDTTFRWNRYRSDWSSVLLEESQYNPSPGFPRGEAGKAVTRGDWQGFEVNAAAVMESEETIRYSIQFHSDSPIDTPTLAMVVNLPTGVQWNLSAEGRKLDLPANNQGPTVFDKEVTTFQIELDGRIISWEGKFRLLVQDNREWNINSFIIRLCPATQWNGKIQDSTLNATIRIQSPQTESIDLSPVASGFFKELPDAGSWTENVPGTGFELSDLPEELVVQGVRFKIPKTSGKRSCVFVSSDREASLVLADDIRTRFSGKKAPFYLYLLHASAESSKTPSAAGTIEIEFVDGRKTLLQVTPGRDIGNWHQPSRLANAAVAWTTEIPESFAGLYLSEFQLDGIPERVTFRIQGDKAPAWVIAGCSLGNRKLDLEKIDAPFYCAAGEEWIALEFTGRTCADSPLDFSKYLDAPAGKYGPVVATPEGRFSFRDAPEKRIRFFGPNLIGMANYLPRELADDFVAKAASIGYNAVRFHHFDGLLALDDATSSLDFDPVRLDQLDYLFSELKKHGIYSCLDIYCSRPLRAGDRVQECGERKADLLEMKILAPISPSAMANWKDFARKLLTHRNPYTGLTWAEDPALALVNLINENPLVEIWNLCPQLIPLYEERYYRYLQDKNLDTPENRATRGTLFLQFLNELQLRCLEEQKNFLKNELKLTALISDVNMLNTSVLHEIRERLDFVDNHNYWGHPIFLEKPWELPYGFVQDSSIAHHAAVPREMMPTRIFGKPFTVTEFNYCNPNPFRMEGAPLMGGYAALQDWDGLFRFAWSHNNYAMNHLNSPQGFDIVNDPQAQLGERIINLLFCRGYVSAAEPAFAFSWTPEALNGIEELHRCGSFPQDFSLLGLYGRIGSLNADSDFPKVRKLDILHKKWQSQLPQELRAILKELHSGHAIVSATGEISLDARGNRLKIVTPRTEIFTLSGNASGRIMHLKESSGFQTVALLSADGKTLETSESILLFQLPNLAGTGQKFSNARREVLESWGGLPILLERASVDIELNLPGNWNVEALKLDGSSNGPVPVEFRNGVLHFRADTSARPGGVMIYHLIRKKTSLDIPESKDR